MPQQDDQISVFRDHASLAEYAANLILNKAVESVKDHGHFSFVLSGGGTPRPVYELLATPPFIDVFPWSETMIFWGDERCVPPEHEESNYGQAWNLLLRHTQVKSENIHRIKGELKPALAANDYANELQKMGAGRSRWPRFDLVLLGLGEDGHTASLFPGEELDEVKLEPVIAVTADYGGRPATRVTLTPLVFNHAHHIVFLVVGASKAKAVAAALEGNFDPEKWPVQRIRPPDGLMSWLLDEAAAKGLSLTKEIL